MQELSKNINLQAILATDINFGIAKNGNIPWKNSIDMNFFKMKTINNIVIMGSNTLLSLPSSKPLKNRYNIVLTNNKQKYINKYLIYDNIIFLNYDELIQYLNTYKNISNKIFYVIGGKEIYELLIPHCNKIWLSIINANYDCDLKINLDLNNCNINYEYIDDDLTICSLKNKK